MKPQPKGGKNKATKRLRERLNITLSDEAREMAEKIAAANGMTLSRLVEMMTREKFKRDGLL